MLIIFVAPFLFAAGSFFILLSSFSATRRYAITVPAGILAFGPGSLIVCLFSALIGYKSLRAPGCGDMAEPSRVRPGRARERMSFRRVRSIAGAVAERNSVSPGRGGISILQLLCGVDGNAHRAKHRIPLCQSRHICDRHVRRDSPGQHICGFALVQGCGASRFLSESDRCMTFREGLAWESRLQ